MRFFRNIFVALVIPYVLLGCSPSGGQPGVIGPRDAASNNEAPNLLPKVPEGPEVTDKADVPEPPPEDVADDENQDAAPEPGAAAGDGGGLHPKLAFLSVADDGDLLFQIIMY